MVLHNYMNKYKLEATILAKLEYFNPAGSVKDRVAREMLDDAEARGLLKAGATILARRPENKGKNIVVLLPGTGERYLSTPMRTHPRIKHEVCR